MSLLHATSRRGRLLSLVGAVIAAAAVPFVATGLWRLNLPPVVVGGLLLAAPVGLYAVTRRGKWLAAGWVVGLAVYFVFMVWLFSTFSTGD